jgi:hypothetical protein
MIAFCVECYVDDKNKILKGHDFLIHTDLIVDCDMHAVEACLF